MLTSGGDFNYSNKGKEDSISQHHAGGSFGNLNELRQEELEIYREGENGPHSHIPEGVKEFSNTDNSFVKLERMLEERMKDERVVVPPPGAKCVTHKNSGRLLPADYFEDDSSAEFRERKYQIHPKTTVAKPIEINDPARNLVSQ